MVKIISYLMIIAICGLTGATVANNYRLRPWQLRQMQTGLQMLETEMAFAATPLPEALIKISLQLEKPVAGLFAASGKMLQEKSSFNVRESWQQGLKELAETSALREKDLALLENLGHTLGLSDLEGQLKQLRLAREQLKQHELAAEEEKAKGEKLWRYTGFLTGLIIVLLIL